MLKVGTLVTDSDKPYHKSKDKRYYLIDRIAEFSKLLKLNYDVHVFARYTDDELIEDLITKALNITNGHYRGRDSFELSNYSTTKRKRAHLVEVLRDLLTDEWDAEDHVDKTEDELISSIIDAMWYFVE